MPPFSNRGFFARLDTDIVAFVVMFAYLLYEQLFIVFFQYYIPNKMLYQGVAQTQYLLYYCPATTPNSCVLKPRHPPGSGVLFCVHPTPDGQRSQLSPSSPDGRSQWLLLIFEGPLIMDEIRNTGCD